jgi:anti-anti-sigma regulatory factor
MSLPRRGGLEGKAMKGGPPLVAPDDRPTPQPSGARPTASGAYEIAVRGRIDDAAVARLCARVRAAVEGGPDEVVCDAARLSEASLAAISLLARLQLTARRLGGRVRVRNASPELHDLLALAGLCDVVGACPPLPVEALGQPEQREELLGVEEECDPGDPVP